VAEAQRARAPVVMRGQRQLGKRVGVKVHIVFYFGCVSVDVGWVVGGLVDGTRYLG
jgi:hypothetical protein